MPNYATQAKHEAARELSEQTFHLAQRTQDQAFLIEAHYIQGGALLWIGEFAAARAHFEQGLLGYPDQALRRENEAIALAQKLSHLNSLGFALDVATMIHQLRREWQATQKRAEATITIGTEQGFPYWVAQGTMFLGSAVAEQGQEEKGLELMRQGFAARRVIGGRILEQYWLALQIEAHLKIGQFEKGFAVLAEAFAVAENGERIWEAEVYRLKGELLLAQASEQATGNGQQGKVTDF